MDMIIRKRLHDDHATPEPVTIDEAVTRLQAYGSKPVATRAAIIADLDAGNMLCTNFYSYQRANVTRKVVACAQSSLMVERYLLGELTDVALVIFEEHMVRCDVCTQAVRAGRALIQGIKDVGGSHGK